tara:strand:- start:104 stop:661 length:558 start_codon:yes stop_codon:yes gene_type:complete
MLGLGNSIVNQGLVEKATIGSFTSDFTGGGGDNSSSIVEVSVQGSLTFTTNQSIGGQDDWLKIKYDTTQTDALSGIQIQDIVGTPGVVGDKLDFSYKIYIVNSGGLWDPEGDSDGVSTTTQIFGVTTTSVITTDQIVTVSGTIVANSIYNAGTNDFLLATFVVPDDFPQEDAVFYIKDVVVTVVR